MPVGVKILEVAVDGISDASAAGVAVTNGWEGASEVVTRGSTGVDGADVGVSADLGSV